MYSLAGELLSVNVLVAAISFEAHSACMVAILADGQVT